MVALIPFVRSGKIFLLMLLAWPSFAAINAYQFDDPAEEQRFRDLIGELRCPKCQNQNIADSNAPLSQDLRQRAYEMIQEGNSNAEITDYMVSRYGDFITYRPPLKPSTWLLWFGPFIIVFAVALGLAAWMRRRDRGAPAPQLTEQERQRLKTLLDAEDNN